MRIAALAWLLLLLSAAAPAQEPAPVDEDAIVIDVVCPNGVRFLGSLSRCSCCVSCPDGGWFVEGEGECDGEGGSGSRGEAAQGEEGARDGEGSGSGPVLLVLLIAAVVVLVLMWRRRSQDTRTSPYG